MLQPHRFCLWSFPKEFINLKRRNDLLRQDGGCCSVTKLCRVRLFATPWTAARQGPLSFTISWSLLKLISTELKMPFNHLILCHPLLLLPSTFPSIRVFSGELAFHIRWSKYWRFSFGMSPSNEKGLTSFKIDWFDLLSVKRTQVRWKCR